MFVSARAGPTTVGIQACTRHRASTVDIQRPVSARTGPTTVGIQVHARRHMGPGESIEKKARLGVHEQGLLISNLSNVVWDKCHIRPSGLSLTFRRSLPVIHSKPLSVTYIRARARSTP